ncbi:unnamed protein product [Paramecium primaurelia]|uniref:Uncharacterized protein n=1 Tax=Paramecium primaurelia TaxID=5886 RepID=A0A8S1MY84_PARPR|nr:unnamed protein product [Paramecium primaurelia]
MEQILILIKQLYNENEEIRKLSEEELNNIFNDFEKIKIGFECLCNQNIEKSLRVQFFIYLKHYLQQNYRTILINHKDDILNILLFYLNKVDQQIIPLLCKLINFMILNTPDSTQIIICIMDKLLLDISYIQLITEMMSNQIVKIKLKLSGYKYNFSKIYQFFNINDYNIIDLILNFYISLTNSLIYLLEDNDYITIINQYCSFISNNPQQSNILGKFSKIIIRLIQKKLPPEHIQQQLFSIITYNYLDSQYHLDRITAYRLLKILNQIQTSQKINYQKQRELLIFIVINIIYLDLHSYQYLYLNFDDENENDYYLLKIRNFGIDMLLTILKQDQQNKIFQEILLISDQVVPFHTNEESICIKKEAHYYIISNLFYKIPIHQIDQLFLQELLQCLKQTNNIYIPIKIQVLILLKRFLLKQIIQNQSQIDYLLSILKEQLQIIAQINNPNLLCAMIDLLVCLQLFYPQKNCLNKQIYLDLKLYYSLQNKLIFKQSIIKCMVELEQLHLGDNSLILIVQQELLKAQQEQNFQKYQLKMLIDVMSFIVEKQYTYQITLYLNIIYTLVHSSLQQLKHQQASLNLLNLFLKKLLIQQEIKSNDHEISIRMIQILFIDCLDEDPDLFENIVQTYYLILLHDVADLNIALQFITKYVKHLKNQNFLSLFCLFLFRLKKGLFQQEIQQFYKQLYEDIEQDDGRTSNELLCGLSILDINQYEIKEIMLNQQDVLYIMTNKAIQFITYKNKFYINYLINFYQSMITKKHLIFDMEQLSLNNSFLVKLHEFITQLVIKQEDTQYSIINQIQKIFEISYLTKLFINDKIIQKFQTSIIMIQSQDDLNLNELKLS